MNSVLSNKAFKTLSLALLLGVIVAQAKKMIETDGHFMVKRTNRHKTAANINKRMSLAKDPKLPDKPGKPQNDPNQGVVEYEDYIEKDMQDYYDVQLFSKVYVGSNRQPFDLILDTGSSWTWFQGSDCNTCPTYDRFDVSESTTYQQTS